MTNQETERTNRPAAQPLGGRRALVTGGASGIGLAVVHALASRGAHVVVADMDQAGAEAVAKEVGGSSWAVDLLDPSAVSDDRLTEALDGVDILVNNAGIQHVSPIQDFNPEDFRRILTLMLEVPFLLIRAALPKMYAQGFGRI
ncbi:MAG TPA: SDR family NAD(P)-dependent oxidoreductase, partial [Arthrobacter sp.]|nr:SDR family NAD(P)-dependent oxidoreductase [Arthrobacter sp.]